MLVLVVVSAMANKHLINSADSCVDECLYGFSKLHPHLNLDIERKIVFIGNGKKKRNVSVISGGGSGHEPFPAGYVGEGMLTASVSGSMFASPPSSNILHAIRLAANSSEGVFLIIPNYTGDVLQFGLAAETAISEGVPLESIIVGEDISQDVYGTTSKAGKRGMCGIVLVAKICGYLSEMGENLGTIKQLSRQGVESMASVGVCLSPCSKPGTGILFHLNDDEMDFGVGVHGEAGVARIKLLSAHETVKMVLTYLTKHAKVCAGDEVVALVNNLGSLTHIEEWLIAGEVEKQLQERSITTVRLYAGCFFTSLNMAGIQICIMKLGPDNRKIFLQALDHQTRVSAWPNAIEAFSKELFSFSPGKSPMNKRPGKISKHFHLLTPEKVTLFNECLKKALNELIKEEIHLNKLDSVCGDGDCGTTLGSLAKKILSKINANTLDLANPVQLFSDLSLITQETIGGTSGAIYGLFFKGISTELEKCDSINEGLAISKSWRGGIDSIKKYSAARLGDKTMLDSLETACEVFERSMEHQPENIVEAFRNSVKAAEEGCRKTATMRALAGRASYVDQFQKKNVDAGAHAVTVWLSAIIRVLNMRGSKQPTK